MTKDQKTLTEAIEIALKNGWDPSVQYYPKRQSWIFESLPYMMLHTEHDFIYNHDFARALWGVGMPWIGADTIYPTENRDEIVYDKPPTERFTEPIAFTEFTVTGSFSKEPSLLAWQYHLQQMVIAENPIEYLRDNLPKT